METSTLLFDLDGTLVNTDNIYCEVWNEILIEYNLNCNICFFNNFIKGKNDALFLKYMIPNISSSEISNISLKKDELFIKKIETNKPQILIAGAFEFIERYKNNNNAIVTSCNKKSALYILQYTNIYQFVKLLIAADDCNNHKPHPEPYLKAIDYFKVDKNECIIFEDSYSGFTSAMNSGVPNICIIKNEDTCKELLDNEYHKISNYNKLQFEKIIKKNSNSDLILDKIKNLLSYYPNLNIKKNNNENIKCGYICDIQRMKIVYNNNNEDDIIIKISNLDNELSKTAIELDMYNNEVKFYCLFSKIMNINIPNFYGNFKIENRDAIVLESLYKYPGQFNINLNTDINNLLNVVKNIFKMHNLFYFDSENSVPELFTSLKKINQITYYRTLVEQRFEKFVRKNKSLFYENDLKNLNYIYENFHNIISESSQYPLSFCHGDLKSPNIFYKNNEDPYFLDWQYIHLNKGISDIAFLLVESIDFDKISVEIVINYYYKLLNNYHKIDYKTFLNDFKNALCIFPFFVCVWFNSEDSDKLLDPVFPIKFMKNLLKYYDYINLFNS
jgi:HAD superfamily hydrolase (TIGR01509 family)